MWEAEKVAEARRLASAGHSATAIGRSIGVPRATVGRWVHGCWEGRSGNDRGCWRCGEREPFPFPAVREWAYSYLLGQYLGDGCLTHHPKGVFRLQIASFAGHPRLIGETVAAASIVMPASRASTYASTKCRLTTIGSYSRHWPCLFPQHGPGLKHKRRIELSAWQREICDRFPDRLLRGLIHSDGCRSINTIRHPQRTYRYPRYQFSNRSDDIRGIFCEYCDRIGVEWRVMNGWTISVARRRSVEKLDRVIGSKR